MASNDIPKLDSDVTSEVNVDNEEVQYGDKREIKQTEKFSQWRLETYQSHFRQAVSSWRKQATNLEKLLSETKDINLLKTARDTLDIKMSDVIQNYEELSSISTSSDIFTTYDKIEQDNFQLSKAISDQIRGIQSDNIETSSQLSIKTTSSRRSRHSQVDAAAEAAALRAKLEFLDIEALQRAELEQKRHELEKTQTLKEFNMAQAKLDAIVKFESEEYKANTEIDLPSAVRSELVADYVQTHSKIPDRVEPVSPLKQSSKLNPSAPIFNYIQTSIPVTTNNDNVNPSSTKQAPTFNQLYYPNTYPTNSDVAPAYAQRILECPSKPNSELEGVMKSLIEQVSLNRLPPPEPGMFSGDPLTYPAWISSFQTLVGNKGIPQNERIYYLKKYLGGQAKEAVEGFLLLTTDAAYTQAMTLLQERYGDSFVIANSFRKKLDNWPKIPPRDGNALRKYSDFLKQCEIAMQSINSLRVLNDDQENRKMLMKLPDWLTLRWGRIVSESREQLRDYPPFSVFVSFVAKEAKIACDPVASLQSLKANIKSVDSDYTSTYNDKRRSVGRSYATETKGTSNDIQKKTCLFCKKSHNIDDCYVFLGKDLQDRKDFAKTSGLCFGCLEHGHLSKNCKHRLKCKTCFKQHPTSLHGDKRKPAKTEFTDTPAKSVVSHAGINNKHDFEKTCKCSMIVPVWLSHSKNTEKEVLVYALLDTQSDTTFVLESICNDLDVNGPNVDLLLSTMSAENQRVRCRKLDGLIVRGHDSDLRIPLPSTYSRELMPSNRAHIPTPDIASKLPHLEQIADKLMPLSDAPVGLLIGYNCSRALAPRDVIAPECDEPYAQRTDLGWGIVGVVHLEQNENDLIGVSHHILAQSALDNVTSTNCIQISLQTRIKESITPVEVAHMMEMDFNECNSDEQGSSFDDLQFFKLMKENIHMTHDHHYEMPLPLKDPNHILPNNRYVALRRLKHLETRFYKDPKYRIDYWSFMQKMINDGYAERVPENELQFQDGHTWYIPHHGVYHPKNPNKIRVVFDCSSKCRGESLNDILIQGPDLMNKLVGVLCRFRQEQVAFVCDIEQMFYQFHVDQAHRNLLRFLWWDSEDLKEQPVEYRMKVHIFGAASSPACANFGLQQAATDFEEEFGSDASKFVKNDFYVDDVLKSVASVNEAINLIANTTSMCQRGGLRLHKFTYNNREVISSIPFKDRAQELQDIDLAHDSLPVERTLGICWCVQSDIFKFRIILQEKPPTRRGILSTISSIYDPLGFLAPVLLIGKKILQQLCKAKADWDTNLPDSLKLHWEEWKDSLCLLDTLEIPRCFKPSNFGNIKTIELHHFSDASTSGYGQCSYLRLIDDNDQVHCTLVMGKARVAPLKTVTIPRLELTAALVSVRVSTFLGRELEYSDVQNYYWTDSKIVLGYLSNDSRRFHVFVSNRVQEIRRHTTPNQWQYVNTNENPADEASRGLSVQKFISKSMWITGPAFLWKPNLPSLTEDYEHVELQPNDPEVKQVKTLATQVTSPLAPLLARLERFSTWTSARRAIAVCLRLSSKKRDTRYIPCNVDQLLKADTQIIRLLQECEFKDELESLRQSTPDANKPATVFKLIKKSSPLYRLDPYIDNQGVVRVGDRIKHSGCTDQLKHPVILPKRHHITQLIIRHVHEQVQHQGRGITVNALRDSGYWILGCSSAVYHYISKCVKCRRFRSKVQEQKMADLPEDRVNPAPPFTYCGVDCFGPWYIKEGRKELKRYGVLFTCMSSRAVHLETVNSMTTDSFINCLRRFLAVRGPIRQLRCDQGTNFVGAANELKEALSKIDNEQIRSFVLPNNCDYFDFKMNTPSASHMGGVWERQIRTVRNIMTSLLDQSGHQLDDESLRTLMCEVMAIVNSRPLTTDNLNDVNSPEPLTPNHLLTMKSRVILPPPGTFMREDVYSRKRWRRVQHLADQFWQRWKREYLQTIQLRQKWTKPRRDIQTGDVVIIKDDNLPRNQWLLARVVEVFPGDDGHVRTVKLSIGDRNRDTKGKRVNQPSYLNRPIQKLVLLLENE